MGNAGRGDKKLETRQPKNENRRKEDLCLAVKFARAELSEWEAFNPRQEENQKEEEIQIGGGRSV